MKQIQCPNCKSYKVSNSRTLGIILFLGGMVFFWTGLGLLIALIGLVQIFMPKKNNCLACNYKWE